MLEYWRFLRKETSLVAFGILLTFASSFGQTFFISLFVPSILQDFDLSPSRFGTAYSVATLGSALLLPLAGRAIDRIELPRYTATVLSGLGASAFLLASAGHLVLLVVALLGLRLTGQGLAPHTGLTAMARLLPEARGKALSLASLGFPLGEATLPLLVTAGLAAIHWRLGWVVAGAVALAGFLPLALGALRRADRVAVAETEAESPARDTADPGDAEKADEVGERRHRTRGKEEVGTPAGQPTGSAARPAASWTLGRALRDVRFWLVLPAALLPPFWTTGLILYQARLAELKGWPLAVMASAFVAFATARVVFSLAVGGGIDRWSARVLFPAAPLPLGLGVAALALFDEPWVAFVTLGLMGTTVGMTGNLKTALWAELYGTGYLGAIRSLNGAFMVASTAAAPLVVGAAVEDPAAVPPLLWGAVASVGLGGGLAFMAVRRGAPPPERP